MSPPKRIAASGHTVDASAGMRYETSATKLGTKPITKATIPTKAPISHSMTAAVRCIGRPLYLIRSYGIVLHNHMPEKTPLPRHPDEKTDPAAGDGGFIPTATEENILAVMHERTSNHRGEKSIKDPELIERLHKDVEQCECYPLFQRYVNGELPTIRRMFANLGPILEDLRTDIEKEVARATQTGDESYVTDLQTTYKLLQGREKQIRGSIQRYVGSVIRFRHLARISAGGDRDVTKQFVEADHARRRAHNNLIDSLATYTKQVGALEELGYSGSKHFPFRYWKSHENARDIPDDKTPIMDGSVLENRDFVRDWAIVADFRDQLEMLGDE